jgi:hypothetical protein
VTYLAPASDQPGGVSREAHLDVSKAFELDDGLFLAAGLAWGGCLIHAEAAVDHLQEAVSFAAFFLLLALAQLAWGIGVYRRPTRRLLMVGAAASLMVAALWVVSRTTGVPFGPEPWTAEPVGISDVLATAGELVLAFIVLLHFRADRGGATTRGISGLLTCVGVFLLLLTSMSLTLGEHVH